MNDENVLLTGTPRSATTLSCHLLNKLPETVALHEPMRARRFDELGDHAAICREIERFCDDQRRSIRERRRAISKQADGAVPDNPFGAERTTAGLRQSVVTKGEVVVDKALSPHFTLIVKHIAAFTALLEEAVKHFPVYAVVRNPLANLASWGSIDFALQRGHIPAAERIDPALKTKLSAIDDDLDRQIYLLDWFHAQYRRHLAEDRIIRYESIVETGGRALAVVRPEAASLDEPLESRNANRLYDHGQMLRLGERLLRSDGAYWESYSKESVERLLNELEATAPS